MNAAITRESLIAEIEAARARGETPDLSGQDLSGLDLAGLDLHGANLAGAILRMADLTKANLDGCHLQHADLYGANLSQASLQNADLSGATLSKAMLYSTHLAHTDLEGADLSGSLLYTATLCGASLNKAILHDANLGRADLHEATLRNATLCGASCIEADLSQADLRDSALNGANLRGATLQGALLSAANLEDAVLTHARYDAATTWPESFTPPDDAVHVDQTTALPQSRPFPRVARSSRFQRAKAPGKAVFYLHGFASSPQGGKGRYFEEQCRSLPDVTFHAFDFTPTPADFECMTLTGLINRLRQYIVDHGLTDVRLIGSSLGGLVALQYAHLFGGVGKMLLLAPAVAYQPEWIDEAVLQQWKESGSRDVFHYAFNTLLPLWYTYYLDGQHYAEAVPPAAPTLIIHGEQDEVVSVAHSRAYVERFPSSTRLIVVDSDHRLQDQLPLIWEHVQTFLLG